MVKFKALTAFVCLAGICGVGEAATLVVNCTIIGTSSTELVVTVTCNQFNIVGATLQSVQISMSGQITGSLVLANNGGVVQTGTDTTTSDFNVGPLPGFSIVNPLFTPSYTTGPQSVLPGQTITFSGLIGSGGGNLGTNSANLAPYAGAGTFAIPVSTVTSFNGVMSGGNFDVQEFSTSASVTAVVTYAYLPAGTPPPVTDIPTLDEWSLIALGLLVLFAGGVTLRRRKGDA
jgi:hypothetical protein